ncbi:hypothetical protein BN2537_16183 [Streptomyces venezuelae]|nr:hypothetical protein BN2537_16183 [Streptomyces venezuelae]
MCRSVRSFGEVACHAMIISERADREGRRSRRTPARVRPYHRGL